MADVRANIAPFINNRFVITSKWWSERGGQIHKGLDIATPVGVPVYSMVTNGKVIEMWNNHVSMGNALVIKSMDDNVATLYMHLASFNVSLNDIVQRGQQVGVEGTTGQSTGIHLHVEMADMGTSVHWNFNGQKRDYMNPCTYMGIPNVVGTWCIYDGTPIPPSPTPTSRKGKHFKWVLYADKLRKNLT